MSDQRRLYAVLLGLALAGASGFVGIASAVDTDGDGLQDAWEALYNGPGCLLGPMWDSSVPANGISDGLEDYDADGATNIAEETPYNTNPCIADTDGDGLLDGWEITLAASGVADFHPKMVDADADGVGDQNEDPDADGLLALGEQAALTSTLYWDSDYDGCSDAVDASPTVNPSFAGMDVDGDGIVGGTELGLGMFPDTPLGRHGHSGDGDYDGFTYFTETSNAMNPNAADADGDGDGMPTAWEVTFALNVAVNDAGADMDADGLTNLAEFLQGTPPSPAPGSVDADTDADGMADAYENVVGTNAAVPDAGADLDGDGLTNMQEWQGGSDPAAWTADIDHDWLCDAWELASGLSVAADSRNLDPDADTFSNWVEYVQGMNPAGADADTDTDGLADAWETTYSGGLGMVAGGDPDLDGFTNIQEFQTSSHPFSPDADADFDGMPDVWEKKYDTVTANLPAAPGNTDGDLQTDFAEYGLGTNPDDALN